MPDMEDVPPGAPPSQKHPNEQLGPRLALLGWCDHAVEVTAGLPAFWHKNILGLSFVRVSHVYPLGLRGHKLLIAIYQPKIGETFQLVFRRSNRDLAFEITFTASSGEIHDKADGPPRKAEPGTFLPGWICDVVEVEPNALVPEPDRYDSFLRDEHGQERFLASLPFLHSPAQQLTPEVIAAIRTNPHAAKSVRAKYSCSNCGDTLKAYAGIERNQKLEQEGWILNTELPLRFKCSCGKADLNLEYLKTGLHGLLGQTFKPAIGSVTDFVPFYKRSLLEEYCREFNRLVSSNPREEEVQNFLESHEVFFARFVPLKRMYKKPVLSKYKVDFAILNERKELLLIEIERPGIRLLT